MSAVIERADKWVMPTYRRLPVTFVRGEGVELFDDQGGRYLDFVAGIAVTALGHAHPAVTEAVAKQAAQLVHTSNLYYTEPFGRLAETLCGKLGWPDGKVFFANSGAEANECAIKLVRRWALDRYGPQRFGIVAAEGSFHGRTLAALAATGQPAKWEPFEPMPQGFTHVAYNDAQALEEALDGSHSAVLLEPIQGEGGVVVPTGGYLGSVRRTCDAQGMALMADEVQTGLGRTGRWFGFEHSAVVPDVVTLAKALGNGFPIGACVARGELAEAFRPGDHATTAGGGPVVCAAALAVLQTIEDQDLVSHAATAGAGLKLNLQELVSRHDLAVSVRGEGLLLGVQLREEVASDVVTAALEKGLLVNNVAPSVVRLCPPLIVDRQQCETAVDILDAVLSQVGGGPRP
ncbi:MAG: acetylornithine transaminase [Actinomycetota bacterium]